MLHVFLVCHINDNSFRIPTDIQAINFDMLPCVSQFIDLLPCTYKDQALYSKLSNGQIMILVYDRIESINLLIISTARKHGQVGLISFV